MARLTVSALGPPEGSFLLHVSDIHNSLRGFRYASALAEVLAPRLVVNTGDMSGAPPPAEAVLLPAVLRIRRPQVFSPGNHDTALTNRILRGMGAVVLDRPKLVTVAGVRAWGYADPNRSPLFGPPYDANLCRATARVARPPEGEEPYLIAVHNSRMVERPPPEVPIVFSGHRHMPAVERRRGVVWVRCGSTGGGGPFGGPLQAAVVDLALPEHKPLRVWLVETDGRTVSARGCPV